MDQVTSRVHKAPSEASNSNNGIVKDVNGLPAWKGKASRRGKAGGYF